MIPNGLRAQAPIFCSACGAGTIYRNYFVEVVGQIGQCKTKQIDCSADIGKVLGIVVHSANVSARAKMENGIRAIANIHNRSKVGN